MSLLESGEAAKNRSMECCLPKDWSSVEDGPNGTCRRSKQRDPPLRKAALKSKILHKVRQDSSVDPDPVVHPLPAIFKVSRMAHIPLRHSVAQIRLLVPVRLPTSDELVGMCTRAEENDQTAVMKSQESRQRRLAAARIRGFHSLVNKQADAPSASSKLGR